MFGKYEKTNRGFDCVSFKDEYGHACSLQESSRVVFSNSDGSVDDPLGWLWLGLEDGDPKIMKKDAVRLGMKVDGDTSGWMPYPIPEEVLIHTRMHLNETQVRGLVERLTLWLETGRIEKQEDGT